MALPQTLVPILLLNERAVYIFLAGGVNNALNVSQYIEFSATRPCSNGHLRHYRTDHIDNAAGGEAVKVAE